MPVEGQVKSISPQNTAKASQEKPRKIPQIIKVCGDQFSKEKKNPNKNKQKNKKTRLLSLELH